MSGSTGADRIKSRDDFKQFVKSYTTLIKKFPGFESLAPSGSYNSNMAKQDFGDIDLVVHIKTDKDKTALKKELGVFFSKMPDAVIVPFSSPRYNGKKFLNTGEIVTVRYQDKKLGYSVQIDNIIALDHAEANFKLSFLDLPAEKQGLVLGLVKIATIETDPSVLFKKLGIHAPLELPPDTEYEFNLSSIELQLRRVTYEHGTYKQASREILWTSRKFTDIEHLLYQYNLRTSFDDLLSQARKKIRNPRSNQRMQGVFTSMISVKSGEVGTAKGRGKEEAIAKVRKIFGESAMLSFTEFRDLME